MWGSFRCFQLFVRESCSKRLSVARHCKRYSSDRRYYDVVVSGGGMVGCAMAASLGHEPMMEGKRVLLLEGGPPFDKNPTPPTYSSRVCAISPGTQELLSEFGAWQHVLDARFREVKRMQVWESCSRATITFSQDELTDNLAYIVENDVILSAILKQLEVVRDRVDILYNSRVNNYVLSSEQANDEDALPIVELENGEKITTKLLIGADGFKSLLRETAGFHKIQWDYNQFAVVATLKLAEGVDNNTAWQRFLKTGPIALLPWSEADIDGTVDHLTQTFDSVLVSLGLTGSSSCQLPPTVLSVEETTRGMFPLGLCHSSQYVCPHVALIGDAAHRIHPLAGQGVNLGFGDVKCLKDKLAEAMYNGENIGSMTSLSDYERDRQSHVVPTMGAVDGLSRLYSADWSPLVLLRSLGLQATNAMGPIKNFLRSRATT